MPITRSPSTDDWLTMHEFDSSLATDYELVLKDISMWTMLDYIYKLG